jgi:GNAT superfamily N-acetyltransferase
MTHQAAPPITYVERFAVDDAVVDPAYQRQSIGTTLVTHAAAAVRARGCEWLHVDFKPHLAAFYAGCGFAPTGAGLMRLS